MKRHERVYAGCLLMLGAAVPALAQEVDRVSLSGYVRAAESFEVIRNARLGVEETGQQAESNRFGFYSLLLEPGTYSITVSSLGYETVTESVVLARSLTRDFTIGLRPLAVENLTVTAEREPPDIDPGSVEMSIARLDVPALSRMPVILGEADPVRALTLFPGVSTANDATTALNVRGGAADENQIFLDDSQVFNPAHAIGLFSTFNPDAVDYVTLYKGAIPARYGGRLSSVLEIQQREGNSREFEGSGTVGLLSSRLAVQGPVFGGSGSYLLAARRTYADLFLKLSSDPDLKESTAYFYDLNAKANYRYGSTGQVMVSGYFGRDRFKGADVFSVGWGNAAGTLRWNQGFGALFSHVALAYSDYDYELINGFTSLGVSWDSRIRSLQAKIDESWTIGPRSQLEFGVSLTDYRIDPANITAIDGSSVVERTFERQKGLSPEAYVEHELDFGRVTVRYGVRGTGFLRKGAGTVRLYENDAPLIYDPVLERYEPGLVVDSTRFANGETIRSDWSLEPRASVRLGLDETSSIKASYSRTRQYLRLITNTNSTSPLDIWEPVGPYVGPSSANQYAVGFVRTFSRGLFSLSTEVYYKQLYDLVDYVDGAQLLLNDRLETTILQGDGRGYGFELLLRKNRGKLQGWTSYTFARARQRTPGITAEDPGINGGEWYPSPYDRTHDLTFVGIYALSDSWTLGANFVYASGLPTTFPVSRYEFGGVILGEFGARNAERLPAYHRLDVSFTKKFKKNELHFGFFNLYNRFNAQALAFRQSQTERYVTEAAQTSVFGIVPSISYRFFF
ncbi:MAG: carboxypeptidase regulatory-like domain-containing protein [Gemmatimonadota bacterium]